MKNILISKLILLIEKYTLEEKVLISPNFEIGNQILENLSSYGKGWINFKVATIASLAEEITEEKFFTDKIEKISKIEANFLIDEIFTKLAEASRLRYFEKHTINTGIINTLTNIVIDLKLSGISPQDIKNEDFVNSSKADDLRDIYLEYEDLLREKGLADTADIIITAYNLLNTSNHDGKIKYIVLSRYVNSKLEKKFLKKLCGSNLIILSEEEIYGLLEPKNRWIGKDGKGYKLPKKGNVKSDGERFQWLFDIENLPHATEDNNIDLFRSYTYQNEIYEIFSRLTGSKIPLDEVEIIYTSPQHYLMTIHNICEKLEIPATFSDGIPGDISDIGMALKGLLLWIKEDFAEIYLRRLLEYSLLNYSKNKKDFKSSQLAHILRISKIGWGRKRYDLVINKEIKELKDKAKEQELGKYQWKIELLEKLKELTQKLLNLVPEIDNSGNVDFKKLCEGCLKYLSYFIKAKNENEAKYLASLKERLTVLARIVSSSIPVEEALQKLNSIIPKITFNKSGPKPGHLHISNYINGGRSGRENTFIVGMDSHKFPGTEIQDPILLDEERKKIDTELILSQDRLKEKLYEAASMLASINGKVTISYSSYDTGNNRKIFPSSVFLQIFRLKTNDCLADYQKMFTEIGEPVGFTNKSKSATAVDDTRWWLNRLAGSGTIKNAKESVLDLYPSLKQGVFANECRKSSMLTEFDGKLNLPKGELDARENSKIVLSCTSIESYVQCPYGYFLEHILRARRPEETIKNLAMWLEPRYRGGLLHEVFQIFCSKLKNSKKYPDFKNQEKMINEILDSVIKKYKEEVPVPGDAVFKRECEDLKRDLKVFLEVNKKLKNPYFLEMEFGRRGKKPVRICIGKDRYIHLAGKVDRVDKAGENSYHVWDYKSGSAYPYNKEDYIAGGKQLQHILYAKVVEEVLKKDNPSSKVTKCGYILPTEKGMGSGKGYIFERDPSETDRWQEAINIILDLISEGLFIVSDEENPPYLDDADIYGDKDLKVQIKQKIGNLQNEILSRWKELRNYK